MPFPIGTPVGVIPVPDFGVVVDRNADTLIHEVDLDASENNENFHRDDLVDMTLPQGRRSKTLSVTVLIGGNGNPYYFERRYKFRVWQGGERKAINSWSITKNSNGHIVRRQRR